MPAFKIYYSPHFAKEWRLLHTAIKNKAILKEAIFRQNPQDQRLKTHALKGKLIGNYAFSIDYHYRIIFYYTSNNSVVFAHIGTHRIYR